MFRLLESGPTKQQLWELPTSRPEFGNSQFGVRGFVITGLIRQVEENLELRGAAATHTVLALNTENKEHRSSSSGPGSSAVPPPTLVLATIGD